MECPPVVIVVAMSKPARAIGYKNTLLWHIPEDMKRFKVLTLGHPIIMGKNTFESILAILGKPLPGRTNIVLTREREYTHDGVRVAHDLVEAIELAKQEMPTEIHIGGGAQLYTEALPLVSRLHVTWVNDEPAADKYFPPFEEDFIIEKTHGEREHGGFTYEWVDYERKSS